LTSGLLFKEQPRYFERQALLNQALGSLPEPFQLVFKLTGRFYAGLFFLSLMLLVRFSYDF